MSWSGLAVLGHEHEAVAWTGLGNARRSVQRAVQGLCSGQACDPSSTQALTFWQNFPVGHA